MQTSFVNTGLNTQGATLAGNRVAIGSTGTVVRTAVKVNAALGKAKPSTTTKVITLTALTHDKLYFSSIPRANCPLFKFIFLSHVIWCHALGGGATWCLL